jgi:hypothetical protein
MTDGGFVNIYLLAAIISGVIGISFILVTHGARGGKKNKGRKKL